MLSFVHIFVVEEILNTHLRECVLALSPESLVVEVALKTQLLSAAPPAPSYRMAHISRVSRGVG
jgi:hypothetical protein